MERDGERTQSVPSRSEVSVCRRVRACAASLYYDTYLCERLEREDAVRTHEHAKAQSHSCGSPTPRDHLTSSRTHNALPAFNVVGIVGHDVVLAAVPRSQLTMVCESTTVDCHGDLVVWDSTHAPLWDRPWDRSNTNKRGLHIVRSSAEH